MTKVVVPIHGEDHCPGGPDEIPCLGPAPYVRRRYTSAGRPAGALICPGLNDVVVSYNDTTAGVPDPDSAEVHASDDWQDYFVLFSGHQIQVVQAGQYTLSGKINWDDWSGNFGSYVVLSDGGTFSEIVSYVLPINEINPNNQGWTFTERYPASQTLQIAVATSSVSNQELRFGYFEVRYDGPYTGPDTNDVDDPDPVE